MGRGGIPDSTPLPVRLSLGLSVRLCPAACFQPPSSRPWPRPPASLCSQPAPPPASVRLRVRPAGLPRGLVCVRLWGRLSPPTPHLSPAPLCLSTYGSAYFSAHPTIHPSVCPHSSVHPSHTPHLSLPPSRKPSPTHPTPHLSVCLSVCRWDSSYQLVSSSIHPYISHPAIHPSLYVPSLSPSILPSLQPCAPTCPPSTWPCSRLHTSVCPSAPVRLSVHASISRTLCLCLLGSPSPYPGCLCLYRHLSHVLCLLRPPSSLFSAPVCPSIPQTHLSVRAHCSLPPPVPAHPISIHPHSPRLSACPPQHSARTRHPAICSPVSVCLSVQPAWPLLTLLYVPACLSAPHPTARPCPSIPPSRHAPYPGPPPRPSPKPPAPFPPSPYTPAPPKRPLSIHSHAMSICLSSCVCPCLFLYSTCPSPYPSVRTSVPIHPSIPIAPIHPA